MTLDIEQLRIRYTKDIPSLKQAKARLLTLIGEVVENLEDKRLVRVRVEKCRIKDLPSLVKKARKHNWATEDVLLHSDDLVGIRIVCNNTDDVYRFRELLEEKLPESGHFIEVQDYIGEPKSTGYRTFHINFSIDVGERILPKNIRCEIQIRTLIQHAWAVLSHSDIYKEDEILPEDLRARFEDLSELLKSADVIAQKIRTRISEKIYAPDILSQEDAVSEEGMAYYFKMIFGRNPPEYVVREAIELSKQIDLMSLEPVRSMAQNVNIREKLKKAYSDNSGFDIEHEELFLLIILAAKEGIKFAIKDATNRGAEFRNDLDASWKGETLGELPEKYEEFLTMLEDERFNIEEIAEALGAINHCLTCSTTIVAIDRFEEEICDHYGHDDYHGEISEILSGLVVEVGDINQDDFCSYHGYVMSKDD